MRKRGSDRHRVLMAIDPDLEPGSNLPDCLCPRLPTQLLSVSRGLYKVTFPVLYSGNKLVLRALSPNDLGLLLSLNNHVLSTMEYLLVRLNFWPCVRGHEAVSCNRSKCWNCSTPSTKLDYALSVTSSAGQYLFAEWKKCSSILPQQLYQRS